MRKKTGSSQGDTMSSHYLPNGSMYGENKIGFRTDPCGMPSFVILCCNTKSSVCRIRGKPIKSDPPHPHPVFQAIFNKGSVTGGRRSAPGPRSRPIRPELYIKKSYSLKLSFILFFIPYANLTGASFFDFTV